MTRAWGCVLVMFVGCGDDGPGKLADAPPPIDAAADAANECAPAAGAGTDHANALAGSETWTAAQSPHRIATQVTVPAGATLTIEPCAVIELGAGSTLAVNGTLRAEGTASRRVQIRAANAAQPWRWIDGGTLFLRYTTISGGGLASAQPEQSAMVRVRGATPVDVQNVVLEKSASVGMLLLSGAHFATGSTALQITQSALHPLTIEPTTLTDLPDGMYTGNGTDVIDVARVAIGAIGQNVAVTMHPRGVPYRMGTSFDPNPTQLLGVGNGNTATLTIEAGTTLKFRPGFRLDVVATSGGTLIANGTTAAPITMTSAAAAPAAGDWVGIVFRGLPVTGTKIDHAIIEYAGNPATSTIGFSCGTPPAGASSAQNQGAIVIASSTVGVAPAAFVTNTTIRDSSTNAIDLGYRADPNVDFLATNTFTRIQYCTQTLHRDAANGCPTTIPCPGS